MCQNQLLLPGIIRPCFANCDLCGERTAHDEIHVMPLVFPAWEYVDDNGDTQYRAAGELMAIVCFDCIAFAIFERCAICHRESETSDSEFSAIVAPADDPRNVCAVCINDCAQCEHCGEFTYSNFGDNGRPLCRVCRRDHFAQCRDCRDTVERDRIAELCGREVCESCAENYVSCESCCEAVYNEDAVYRRDGYYCQECYSHDDDDIYCCRVGRTITGAPCAETANAARYFGIELEFSDCNYSVFKELCDATGWGACEDGSVAQEIKSPKLSGAAGIESCRKVCAIARRHGLSVDESCGFHLHMDMSEERELALARIACAYQIFLPVWRLFVPQSRRENRYCSYDLCNGSALELAHGTKKPFRDYGERYCAVNWQAYRAHKTVEIRLHTGTTSADKVCNWISAHLSFVEHFRRVSFETMLSLGNGSIDNRWEYLADSVFSPSVHEFYWQRAVDFGTMLPRINRSDLCIA